MPEIDASVSAHVFSWNDTMGRLIPAGTRFEYYRHVRIPADEPPPPPPPTPKELELEREMEYAVYDRAPAEIATAIEMLLSHQTLTIQDADVVSAALENFRKKPALGFSDCLLLEIARKAGHEPLGTLDRDLAKLPGTERL